METQTLWVDRGHALDLGATAGREESPALIVMGRGGSVAVAIPSATLWVVLRGSVEIDCREGRFSLRTGDWLSLERESRPLAYAGSHGLAVGIAMHGGIQVQSQQTNFAALFPGRGTLPVRMRANVLGLWRRSAPFVRNEQRTCLLHRYQSGQLQRFSAALQQDYRGLVDRCPGRSLRRKRQVFARMQRACLHIDGNLDRVVRISELAELANMSIWYFTKTFHSLYGQSPQAASTRMRLAHAAHLLLGTRWSVSEVGVAAGFENNCSFSRAFRAQFGMPPSLYRLSGDVRLPAGQAKPASMAGQAALWAAP